MTGAAADEAGLDNGSKWRSGLLVAGIALVAFAIRLVVSYRAVLAQEYAAFIENDAWYHMRLVDGLIRQFPWRIWQDAYQAHPGGDFTNAGPMFDWIIAAVALVLGLGSPSERLVDLVGAFVPPVMGALTVVPIYLIGKDVFSRQAGILAAVSIAVMPGDVMIRSLLGFTDHHCAEVLFSTLALMSLVRAIDERRLAASRQRYAWLTGAWLGAYLLTWGAGAMFIAALTGWACLELIAARLNGVGSHLERTLGGALVPAFGVAVLLVAPWTTANAVFLYAALALVCGLVAIGVLWTLDRLTTGRPRGQWLYGGALLMLVVGGAVGAALALSNVVSLDELRGGLSRMSPLRPAGTVTEAMPLMRSADWRPVPLWNQFTTSLIVALAALPIVLWRDARRPAVRLLLAVTLFWLLATFGQVRFTYYLAVGVALLAGRGGDFLLSSLAASRPFVRQAAAALLVIAIAAPGVPGMARQSTVTTALTADWFDALQWMRTNTPEPFDDASAYFRNGLPEPVGYGVLSWWDYGYWIARIARRPPVTNPRQTQLREVAQFLTSHDVATARPILEQTGTRYVIVDALMQMSLTRSTEGPGFFGYIARAAERNPTDFCEGLVPPASSDDLPQLYCYPEYYRTMAVRLYAFGGQAVAPRTAWVIEIAPSSPGEPRRIRREMPFASYEAALAFANERPTGQRVIASKDLLASPVPVEALPQFARVYRSVGTQRAGGPSLVQVFEYRP